MSLDTTELVGYAASALVVLALTMPSVVRLRTISLCGAITFLVYGVLIGSVPIMITNVCIATINVWFLSRELGGRRDLGVVVVPPDSPFLTDFLLHHAADIRKFQPEYDSDDEITFAMVLTRDGLPAGVVLGDHDADTLDVTLDYVLPAYRDSRLGYWMYGRGASVFRTEGFTRITAGAGNETHQHYLERVGFTADTSDRYSKQL
jgi:hypothetical protein